MATLAEVLRQAGYVTPQGQVTGPRTDLAQKLKSYVMNIPQNAAQNLANQRADIDAALTMRQGGIEVGDRAAFERQMAEIPNLGGVMKVSGAMRTAQRNAALPVEQGGLGLPPNNTPMDRAKAMGYTEPAYHGTNADIYAFNPLLADTRRKTGTPMGAVVVTSEPATASTYAGQKPLEWIKSYEEGANVMPLLINKGKNMSMNARQGDYTPNWRELYHPKYPDLQSTNDFALIAQKKGKQTATIKNVKDNAVLSSAEGDTTFIFDPSLIRSRFAAFDPKRRKEADILAGALAVPLAADEETRRTLLEKLFNEQQK